MTANPPTFGAQDDHLGVGRGPRVALVAIGIGRTQRGYERFFGDLYGVLRGQMDVTLFGSGGPAGTGGQTPRFLGPLTRLARVLPLGAIAGGSEYRHYRHDCLAYGLGLLPTLARGGYDVVHLIDYPLGRVMAHLRRTSALRAGVIYTNGCCVPPELCPRADRIHHVAKAHHDAALAAGVEPAHLTLVPCGIHSRRFRMPLVRRQLRLKPGIAQSTFVVLAVTAVKRMHKRVDHLIEEVSRLEGDVLLWIDGHPEDPRIPALAGRRMGSRVRITHVPSETVPELYNLSDVLVHGALEEAFGLSIVEAMSAGLPVLVHDSPHFEWLVGDDQCLVDMRTRGLLGRRLREMMAQGEAPQRLAAARAQRTIERFDWSALTGQYVRMYNAVAEQTAGRRASGRRRVGAAEGSI